MFGVSDHRSLHFNDFELVFFHHHLALFAIDLKYLRILYTLTHHTTILGALLTKLKRQKMKKSRRKYGIFLWFVFSAVPDLLRTNEMTHNLYLCEIDNNIIIIFVVVIAAWIRKCQSHYFQFPTLKHNHTWTEKKFINSIKNKNYEYVIWCFCVVARWPYCHIET